MSNITLTAGVRQNLLSLQQTADLMSQTQNRLATGKKVNSALDNPLNFFTSSSLSSRASDLGNLLDSMAGGIQTIQAANNGITAITSLVQQLQSSVSQARSDTTAAAITPGTATVSGANNATQTNSKLTFDLGSGVTVAVDAYTHVNPTASTLLGSGGDFSIDDSAKTLTINDGNGAVAVTATSFDGTESAQDVADQINTDLGAGGSSVHASVVGGQVQLTNGNGGTITVAGTAAADLGFGTGNTTSSNGTPAVNQVKTVDELVDAVNSSAVLAGKVKAEKTAGGKLQIDNLTNTAFTVEGFDGTNITGVSTDTTSLAAGTGAPLSSVRQSLLTQFNNLLTQIDKVATDAGYNGINLLNGDKLTINFNENGTSSIDVQATDSSGNAFAISSANLNIGTQTTSDFASNTTLDSLATTITTALTTLRTQASSLGSQLSVVQTRQDFTKNMINTLQTGSDNLVLADTNEESANLLALQTRQQLSITALSLSAQANQAVLRLFG